MKVSKAQYELFRSRSACYMAIEKVTIPPSSKPNLHKPDNATMPRNVTSSTSTSMISLSHDSQDGEDSGSNITELQYVLHTLLPEAVDGPVVKALEHHGFTTVQDILLRNQAKRDVLHLPKADGILSTLPIGSKNRLMVIKLFGQYCEDEGKPIDNWKQVTKEELNHFRCYSFNHVAEKLTVHPSFKVNSVPVQTFEAFYQL